MKQGLYDSAYEHDACGVGFVCKVNGTPSHEVVQKGLQVLVDLDHRGACGCDGLTGDGAGILMQVPHRFFEETGTKDLPAPGQYGVGCAFLPKDACRQHLFKELIENAVRTEGQRFLSWRKVPTNNSSIGMLAQSTEPSVWQFFVVPEDDIADGEQFERKLFLIRKVFQNAAHTLRTESENAYISSLSTRTLIYKGMLTPGQLPQYYPDLRHPAMESAVAMVHSRFSTNTFPEWSLAHPFRFLSHNGEINTLRGNVNQMRAGEAILHSRHFGEDTQKLLPIIREGGSDSQALDNALELLYFTGRSLPHSMMMLVPEAWEHNPTMSSEKRAFYQYHSNLMDPWDGPATILFSDGRFVGALLDRNGLRPSRYTVTKDGLVILASETGVGNPDPANVLRKGRLHPGRMFLIDLHEQRIIDDRELKQIISCKRPYKQWVQENTLTLDDIPVVAEPPCMSSDARKKREQMFGYTLEDLRIILQPMSTDAKEPLGSMGDDTPLAVLSNRPRMLYDYFKQLFAQVTNPPLDAIREELVTSLALNLGTNQDLFSETPLHCRKLRVQQPILTEQQLLQVTSFNAPGFVAATVEACFEEGALESALTDLQHRAAEEVRNGASILVLSDRTAGKDVLPVPALLAISAVHHHLIQEGLRTKCGLIVDSGEPREVHHMALLIGYGAEAVCPYLAIESVRVLAETGVVVGMTSDEGVYRYIKAIGKGLLKVMSKMGISTLQSYRGAQIFEAVGIGREVTEKYFCGTPSRLGGIGLNTIAEEVRRRHMRAYPPKKISGILPLDPGGRYQWRRGGEHHLFTPTAIANVQHAVRSNSEDAYARFSAEVNEQNERRATLRGLFDFNMDNAKAIPVEEVEPWTDIVTRFKSGAMSNGSISGETHESLAIAMNALGGKSNTGEGGEDPKRYPLDSPRRSRIKQVASGRFGVTIGYLASADEIQIKMAQGAKPGEGGQLPGKKVYPWIAKLRHSTPYVGLISPPPHHDIYSIEDLAQLIFDLKNSNPGARVSVKLVSEVGVGTIAAGVAKGKADVVLISGSDGGTGASPQTSIMHAGLPWELGLSETHQTLVHHGLRSRIRIECDGQMKTGRDVAIACLLGADEFGFATAPLVALGCIMMRKCHLNTCPVGIATQDPKLRAFFAGKPEHVINYMHFVAKELRQIMAQLGFRTLDEMRGRVDRLRYRRDHAHWKAKHLDLSPILTVQKPPAVLFGKDVSEQEDVLEGALDYRLIELSEPALERKEKVEHSLAIQNTQRTVGTMLSHAIVRRHGERGLPNDTIVFNCYGSAGQSFAAFGAPGLTFRIEGEANDYFGKGLSGSRLILTPPKEATYEPHTNIIVGNVAFYGATRGEAYIRGRAGERFCVRNSGVKVVVEAVGDHGCEYMTGGVVVVLGRTGRNFAAGMSGGIAYVLDGTRDFRNGRCNTEGLDLLPLTEAEDVIELRRMIINHYNYTSSRAARWVLDHWSVAQREFVKVIPVEYQKALFRLASENGAEDSRPLAMAAA